MTETFYAVDIDAKCKGQEFSVKRTTSYYEAGKGFVENGQGIIIVTGMGLYQSYVDNGETTDDIAIRNLLATVDCIPLNVRKCG
jgi:hypothetical protein